MKNKRIHDEKRRLHEGPSRFDKSSGKLVAIFNVTCYDNAEEVLNKVGEVMGIVNHLSSTGVHSLDEWKSTLPNWFVSEFVKDLNETEENEWLNKWRDSSEEEKVRLEFEKGWSLSNWIYWFKPDERQWFWWDSKIQNNDNFQVHIEVLGWPFPWGTLNWLLKVSGASKTEYIDLIEMYE